MDDEAQLDSRRALITCGVRREVRQWGMYELESLRSICHIDAGDRNGGRETLYRK